MDELVELGRIEKDRTAAMHETAHHAIDTLFGTNIYAARWIEHKETMRMHDQRACEHRFLLITARERLYAE